MLAKVITLSKERNVGFAPVVAYVFRDDKSLEKGDREPVGPIEAGQFNLYADMDTVEDRELAADLMNDTSRLVERNGRFKGNPVYHYTINWMEKEHPGKSQVEAAVEHTLKALGMQECEAIWALHRDTDNDHVHVVVNRVHPERGIVIGPPRLDYLILDKAMRELELRQGWDHAPGPHVVIPGRNPEIVRMSKSERRKLGLMPDPGKMAESQKAMRAEKNIGVPSFQNWLAAHVTPHVRQVLESPGSTWQDLHDRLDRFGCSIEIRGSGMIVKTAMEDRTLTAKASHMAYWASQSRLEARLGKFQPSRLRARLEPSSGYAKFVEEIQAGALDGPGITGKDDPERIARRAARAKARQELVVRFKEEQKQAKDQKKQSRKEMRERHTEERKSLNEHLQSNKSFFLEDQARMGIKGTVAHSLWAREKAVAKEALQKRHRQERETFSAARAKGQVWRSWLERQAEMGDEAARAALRGIRYREQRQKEASWNGIEGEELEALSPFRADGTDQPEKNRIMLANLVAEVDKRKQLITYSDEHGNRCFTDEGPRIVVHDKENRGLDAALRLASQKYGGEVKLTGSAEFREEAARAAARLGIQVADEDLKRLWKDEREKLNRERQHSRPMDSQDPER